MKPIRPLGATLLLATLACSSAAARPPLPPAPPAAAATQDGGATMAERIAQYEADRGALGRLWSFPLSEARHARFERLHRDWLATLDAAPFEQLPRREQVDWLLLRNQVEHELRGVALDRAREAEVAPILPFAGPLVVLLEARARREFADPRAAAVTLDAAVQAVAAARAAHEREDARIGGPLANRAAATLDALRRELAGWYRFGAGYDPDFAWWCRTPWTELEQALREHARFLRRELGGLDPDDGDQLVGDPIGREALLAELAHERIAYTPEELIAMAERQLAWCQEQRRAAAAELGFGDDWRAAQEHVKTLHADPGGQPRTIRMLAEEATAFLEERELLTVPELAKEVWRMEMMSAERQKVNPYFTGGEVISISYPTDEMAHADKLMSMRGNNLHYSRATVHHELIPGHHLQMYMAQRWNPQRRPFGTPSTSRAGRSTGSCACGSSTSRRARRTASACCSGAATATRASCSRSTSTSATGRPSSASTSWSRTSATSAATPPPRCAARSRAATARSTSAPTWSAACSCARCTASWSRRAAGASAPSTTPC